MAEDKPLKYAPVGLAPAIRALVPRGILQRIPFAKSSAKYVRAFDENVVGRIIFEMNFPRFQKEQMGMEGADVERLLDFVLDKWGAFIGPAQIRSEIAALLSLVKEREIKRFMEIGTFNGGTLFLFCKALPKDANGISLDLPGGEFGGGYPAYKVPLYMSFPQAEGNLTLLREDSHTDAAGEKVAQLLGQEKLDFLFIDGDHTYDGVKKDFQMYSRFVRDGGIIAFHDIAVHPPDSGCNVHLFWDEIKKEYEYREFIADRAQGTCGIGVIFKKSQA